MNGEGFTGLDPNEALMAIAAFEAEGESVRKEMFEANKAFLDGLSNVWWSEKAKGFGGRAVPKLYEAQESIRIEFNNSIVSAVAAYNNLAQGNGIPDNHKDEEHVDLSGTDSNMYFTNGEGFLNISANDEVGMVLADAQVLIDEFTNKVYQIVIPHLESVPYVIAFYDPGDEMKTAWKTRVAALVKSLQDAVTFVTEDIAAQLEDEMIIVREGAEAAAAEMNNGTNGAA